MRRASLNRRRDCACNFINSEKLSESKVKQNEPEKPQSPWMSLSFPPPSSVCPLRRSRRWHSVKYFFHWENSFIFCEMISLKPKALYFRMRNKFETYHRECGFVVIFLLERHDLRIVFFIFFAIIWGKILGILVKFWVCWLSFPEIAVSGGCAWNTVRSLPTPPRRISIISTGVPAFLLYNHFIHWQIAKSHFLNFIFKSFQFHSFVKHDNRS